MKYVNTKTGAVIETACVIKGEYWEPIKSQPKPLKEESVSTSEEKKSTKKVSKTTRKKSGE